MTNSIFRKLIDIPLENRVFGESHEGMVTTALQQIFPNDYSLILNPLTGKYLEVDIWLPKHNICFEYQDAHHYMTTWYCQTPLEVIQAKDNKNIIRSSNATLVTIPCWWDGFPESLLASILFYNPEIEIGCLNGNNNYNPIPLNPPIDFFKPFGVPFIGELMVASFPKDAQAFYNSISFQNQWWVGEKFDGIRVCWDPVYKLLYLLTILIHTRSGNKMELTSSFMNSFPTSVYVDAEIWFGRGQYMESQKLITSLNTEGWQYLRVVGFDNPSPLLNNLPFEKRFETLLENIERTHPFVNKGEGLILRKPNSPYFHGRSPVLVKLKATQADREGIVVAVSPTSVSIKLPEGAILHVPSRDILLPSPLSSPTSTFSTSPSSSSSSSSSLSLKKGDIVSFSYESSSRHKLPVNPKIYQIRSDLSWLDVKQSAASELSANLINQAEGGKDTEKEKENYAKQKQGFWKAEGRKNMRQFLERFMREKKLRDPLLADDWYLISRKDLKEMEGGDALSGHLKGGFVNTLQSLFPELNLDASKFHRLSNFWHDLKNRRKWFIDIATKRGFDPLCVDPWYNITIPDIIGEKGAHTLLKFYAGSMIKALQHVFPEIHFNPGKFKGAGKTFWQEKTNQRRYLLQFAKKNSFDPLLPNNWYNYFSKLSKAKGIDSLLYYYNGNLSSVLLNLFPKIGLKEIYFPQQASYWRDYKTRKLFFDSYALDHNFDPLVADNWYSRDDDILSMQGIKSLLEHHSNSVAIALKDLYKTVQFDLSKFPNYNKEYWADVKNRRSLFESFASKMNFDPLIQSNWYTISKKSLRLEKGGNMILYMYNNSVTKALNDTFPDIKLKPPPPPKPKNHWDEIPNRRDFFIKFAKDNNFDPLDATNWYNISRDQILMAKGGSRVLYYSNNSLAIALKDLFPDIYFNFSLFQHKPRFFWSTVSNRQKMFEQFAEKHSFDPLVADNWCRLTTDQILELKGEAIVFYHGGSIRKTLNSLFPNLAIEPTNMLY